VPEARAQAALGGHDLGPFDEVEDDEGPAGWQATCRLCGRTVWVGASGLMYTLLANGARSIRPSARGCPERVRSGKMVSVGANQEINDALLAFGETIDPKELFRTAAPEVQSCSVTRTRS
jgi:hypothetical protein